MHMNHIIQLMKHMFLNQLQLYTYMPTAWLQVITANMSGNINCISQLKFHTYM